MGIAVAEDLWGEGFVAPGGVDDVLRLAAPLGLSASASVLLLGAGLGGAVRTLAEEFDAWVSGVEADPTLAALAAKRLKRVGGEVARRASVASWDPESTALKRRGFHHALAFDVIRADESGELLARLAQALKPQGQLVLLQIATDTPIDPADPTLAAWARMERRMPAIPLVADITRSLTRLGLDVRVAEDVSARHIQLALGGWMQLVGTLDDPRPAPAHAAAIVREAERWMRRIRLMREGRLRMMRWHAIAPEAVKAPR